MRITAATMYRDSAVAIERTSEQLLEHQRQVASGKRIGRPSDDPAGAQAAIMERSELGAIEQYQRTADSATARLTVIDTALSDIVDRLTAAQSAVASARGSTKTEIEREAAARKLEGIREALLGDFNTSFHGSYVFAGAASTTPPYVVGSDETVGAYQGSELEVSVDIDSGRSVAIAIDGSAIAQGTAGEHIFDLLDSLAAAMRAGDEGTMSDGMTALQAAFSRATAAQSRVGVDLAGLETQKTQLIERRLVSTAQIAVTEDVNLAEAITAMTQAEAAYRAALGATARTTRTSLMDYLS